MDYICTFPKDFAPNEIPFVFYYSKSIEKVLLQSKFCLIEQDLEVNFSVCAMGSGTAASLQDNMNIYIMYIKDQDAPLSFIRQFYLYLLRSMRYELIFEPPCS